MAFYSKDDLTTMIHEAGLRATEHRTQVLFCMSRAKQPMTVYELTDLLRKKYNIDQATIYRNLISLTETGLIRKLDFNDGQSLYEFEDGRLSPQIICRKCKAIEKIEGVAMEAVLKKIIQKSKKFKITNDYTVQVYGLCKQCS